MNADLNSLIGLLPHGPAMRLIDEVLSACANELHARTRQHQSPMNPMRNAAGKLGAATGVEIAAQCIAMHSAYLAHQAANGSPPEPRGGMLTSVRDLQLARSYLDDIEAALDISVSLQTGDLNAALYTFSIQAAGALVLSGRASVVGFVK